MTTLKEKVFSRITNDFQVMTLETFTQLDLLSQMMDNNHDEELYARITKNELIIDSLEVKIRTEVINTIVLYTPRASNLRMIIAYYDMTAYLERIGDLVLNLANFLRRADLNDPIMCSFKSDLRTMLDTASLMARNAMKAFTESEPDIAKNVIDLDEKVDTLFYNITRQLPKKYSGMSLSEQEMTDILVISSMAYNIERIGDHATNIAEAAV
ncbi:MAG: phosphate signaling complex PhoU family protein, partial [Bacteroidales bacterium]